MTDQASPEEQQLAQLRDELEDLLDQVEAKRKQIKEFKEKRSHSKQPPKKQGEPGAFNPTTEATATPSSVEAKNVDNSNNSTPKSPELPKFTGPEVDYIMEALVDSPNKSKHKSMEIPPEKQMEDNTNNSHLSTNGTSWDGKETKQQDNKPTVPAIQSTSAGINAVVDTDKGVPATKEDRSKTKNELKPKEKGKETSKKTETSGLQSTKHTGKNASDQVGTAKVGKTEDTTKQTTTTTPKSPSRKTTTKQPVNDLSKNKNKRSSTTEPTPVSAPKKTKPNPRHTPIPASDKSKRQKWFQTIYEHVKDEFKMRRRISIFLKTKQQVQEYRELREQGKDDDAFFSPILNLSGDNVLIKQQQHQSKNQAENKTKTNNPQGGRSSRRRGASAAPSDEAKWGSSAEAAAFMLDSTIPAASVDGYLYAVPFEVYAGSPRGPDFNMTQSLEEAFPPLKGPWTEELLTDVLDGIREQIYKKRTKRVD